MDPCGKGESVKETGSQVVDDCLAASGTFWEEGKWANEKEGRKSKGGNTFHLPHPFLLGALLPLSGAGNQVAGKMRDV